MKSIVTAVRVYGPSRHELLKYLQHAVLELKSDLAVDLKTIKITSSGHVKLIVSGDDEEFFINLLKREFGAIPAKSDLIVGATLSGHLTNVGAVGYGVYVNIGYPPTDKMDPLIPLYQLRKQFGLPQQPLRKITSALVLVDNLPIEIVLTDVNPINGKLEAKLSASQLDRIQQWAEDDHERLIVLGVTYPQLATVLEISGHSTDIYAIEQLGPFEYSLQCKRSTRASGILAAIGPKLKGIPIHPFIPKEVEAKRNATA